MILGRQLTHSGLVLADRSRVCIAGMCDWAAHSLRQKSITITVLLLSTVHAIANAAQNVRCFEHRVLDALARFAPVT
jgi:hypothetical protein